MRTAEVGDRNEERGRYIDAKEAASILGLRSGWVRQMAVTGRLGYAYKEGGAWWMSEEAVRERLRTGGDRPGVKYMRPPALSDLTDRQIENVLNSSSGSSEPITDREREVLVLRLGLGDSGRHTLKQVAEEVGLSHEGVRFVERQAAEKVRDIRKRSRRGSRQPRQHSPRESAGDAKSDGKRARRSASSRTSAA